MKIENAIKLAAKVGTVISFPQTDHEKRCRSNRYDVVLSNGNVVRFREMEGLLAGWDRYVRVANGTLQYDNFSYRTLGRCLAAAARTIESLRLDNKEAYIDIAFDWYRGLRKQVTVIIDDCVVCGQPDMVAALAEGALQEKWPGALLDWVEEHTVDRVEPKHGAQGVILL